jgi:hypothetical protein
LFLLDARFSQHRLWGILSSADGRKDCVAFIIWVEKEAKEVTGRISWALNVETYFKETEVDFQETT